jgi:hypothetical protein
LAVALRGDGAQGDRPCSVAQDLVDVDSDRAIREFHALAEEVENIVVTFVVARERTASGDVPGDVRGHDAEGCRHVSLAECVVAAQQQFGVRFGHVRASLS